MKIIEVTHGTTGDSILIIVASIQGFWKSSKMGSNVLILSGNTFIPIKEEWDLIEDMIKNANI